MKLRLFALGILAVLALGACKTGGGSGRPFADLSANVTSGPAPLTVNFDASGSGSAAGAIVRYDWDFDGDGAFDRQTANPLVTHSYTTSGTFQALLRVTDSADATAETTLSIRVQSGTWSVLTLDVVGNTGTHSSAAMVAGRPAVGYSDETSQRPRYTASFSALGNAWGTPITVSSERGAPHMSLAEVDGRPAAAWYNSATDRVVFALAQDASGVNWNLPVPVGLESTSVTEVKLFVVDGNPAMVFLDAQLAGDGDPVYVRALDRLGSGWGSGVLVDEAGEDVTALDAAVVNDLPAVAYVVGTSRRLRFVQGLDRIGDEWFRPEDAVTSGAVGNMISLAVIGGRPAVSYLSTSGANADLFFVRAQNADGTLWDAPIGVDTGADSSGQHNSLASIGGRPGIAYYSLTREQLQYVAATDVGGTSWDTPTVVDATANVGAFASLLSISGSPGISYYNATTGDLKWALLE